MMFHVTRLFVFPLVPPALTEAKWLGGAAGEKEAAEIAASQDSNFPEEWELLRSELPIVGMRALHLASSSSLPAL